jgi:DNA-directed RNA polymerase specialized sigma subunit
MSLHFLSFVFANQRKSRRTRECQRTKNIPSFYQEQLAALWVALQSLPENERSLIDELFFNEKSERKLADIQ